MDSERNPRLSDVVVWRTTEVIERYVIEWDDKRTARMTQWGAMRKVRRMQRRANKSRAWNSQVR